jgi:hypothetical protein
MMVNVSVMTGKQFPVSMDFSDTVRLLKEKIFNLEKIPPKKQRLIYRGKELEDDWTMQGAGIVPHALVSMVFRTKGGSA